MLRNEPGLGLLRLGLNATTSTLSYIPPPLTRERERERERQRERREVPFDLVELGGRRGGKTRKREEK